MCNNRVCAKWLLECACAGFFHAAERLLLYKNELRKKERQVRCEMAVMTSGSETAGQIVRYRTLPRKDLGWFVCELVSVKNVISMSFGWHMT